MIDLAGQLPTIVALIVFRLNDLIVMAGLKNFIGTIRSLLDLSQGDVDILLLPTRIRRYFDRVISEQIVLFVPGQDQLYAGRRILLIKEVVPDLLDVDGLSGQLHGLGAGIVFFSVLVAVQIREGGVQMGVGLQRIAGFFVTLDGILLLLSKIIEFDQAVVQVCDQVVSGLAGPYGELQGIDRSIGKDTDFAQVPGDAVGLVIAGAGSVVPLLHLLSGLRNVVLEAACLAVCYGGAHVGQGRDTVVHGGVAGTQVVNDSLGDLRECRFDGIRGVAVDNVLAVGVGDQIFQVIIAIRVTAEDAIQVADARQRIGVRDSRIVGCLDELARALLLVVPLGVDPTVGIAVCDEQYIGLISGRGCAHAVDAALQACLPAGSVVGSGQSADIVLHRSLGCGPAHAVGIIRAVAEIDCGKVDQVRIRIQRIDQHVQCVLRCIHSGLGAVGHPVRHTLGDVHHDDDVGADLRHMLILLAFDIQLDRVGAVAVIGNGLIRFGSQNLGAGLGRRRIASVALGGVVHIDVAAIRDDGIADLEGISVLL